MSLFTPHQYELLDFGQGRKLERCGGAMIDRPSPMADHLPLARPALWSSAAARYERQDPPRGRWSGTRRLPQPWLLEWRSHDVTARLELRAAPSGQVGVFFEQAENWRWIAEQLRSCPQPVRLLNLFAYTGGSTLVAAAAGAEVVHVDAARSVVAWARTNAIHSSLQQAPIHWVVEDARKFVGRELRRGRSYSAVILDPPTYGHGAGGEAWKLERDLAPLLHDCCQLMHGGPLFLLLTCHTPNWDAAQLRRCLEAAGVRDWHGHIDARALSLVATDGRRLPAGAVVRWRCLSGPPQAARAADEQMP